MQLLNFLLKIVTLSHNIRKSSPWEIQTTVFTMMSEVFSRVGTSLPPDHWQSAVDVSIFCLHD